MIFDGRLWHGTGANTSDSTSLGVLITFCWISRIMLPASR